MRHSLFITIINACEANSNYFNQRRNAAGEMGFSAYQKVSVVKAGKGSGLVGST
jgi:hypothetical protein